MTLASPEVDEVKSQGKHQGFVELERLNEHLDLSIVVQLTAGADRLCQGF